MSNYYPNVDAMYLYKRAGTAEDPYIPINQTITVHYQKVTLKEIPDYTSKVTVKQSDGTTLKEVGQLDILGDDEYWVDYTTGVVHFPSKQNEKTFTFSFKGTGCVSIPGDRIIVNTDETNEAGVTLQDLLDQLGAINNMVTSASQLAEGIRDLVDSSQVVKKSDINNIKDDVQSTVNTLKTITQNAKLTDDNGQLILLDEGINIDNLFVSGFYKMKNPTGNVPTNITDEWIQMLVFKVSDSETTQMLIANVNGTPALFIRSSIGTSNNSFSNWITIENTIDSQAKADMALSNAKKYADEKFLLSDNYTAIDVLNKLKTVDGTGSDLDADTIDGKNYEDIVNELSSATWDDLLLQNGVVSYSDEQKPQYAKIGGFVVIRGILKDVVATGIAYATLPLPYRPLKVWNFTQSVLKSGNYTESAYWQINTDGSVILEKVSEGISDFSKDTQFPIYTMFPIF